MYTVNFDGILQAFDGHTGALAWIVALPNQHSFTSPPTYRNGMVYVGGSTDVLADVAGWYGT